MSSPTPSGFLTAPVLLGVEHPGSCCYKLSSLIQVSERLGQARKGPHGIFHSFTVKLRV